MKQYRKRGAKGRDWAQPAREGQRLVRPKLIIQNAPTKGSRRRSEDDDDESETIDEAFLQPSFSVMRTFAGIMMATADDALIPGTGRFV